MAERLASLLGIFVLLGLGYVFSRARKSIPWRLVVTGILLQVYLALFIVRTEWVSVLLPSAAGICALILGVGLFRPLPGYWLPAARGLGLLGAVTTIVHLAIRHEAWWLLLLTPLPLLFGNKERNLVALAGCLGVVASLFWWGLPEGFVFTAVDGVGDGVMWVAGFAARGAKEVFGDLADARKGYVFAVQVGAIILLFGGLLSVLAYVGVIPWLVGLLARILHRALGVSGAESLAAASNVFVGQTEAPLVIRPYLARMTDSEVMALMAGGFATIAGSVLVVYVDFLRNAGLERGAADLIAASVMSAPAAIVFAKLFVPETGISETREGAALPRDATGTNLLDALAGGITAGLRLAVNVVAMLLVFYALIYVLNDVVEWVARQWFHTDPETLPPTFPELYAYLFAPFAFLIGVPWSECLEVGQLLGTKTIFNEFIAYGDLGEFVRDGAISTRSAVLSTYALCGFANFMSVGIQIGGLSALAPEKRPLFARLALPAMAAGALGCQLTACIVGVLGRF